MALTLKTKTCRNMKICYIMSNSKMSQNMKNQPLTRITRRACENIALWAQLQSFCSTGCRQG